MKDFPQHKLDRIGHILREWGVISEEQLRQAVKQQQQTHEIIGKILVKNGAAGEEAVAKAVAYQLNIPYIEEPAAEADPEAVKLVPESLARRTISIPLSHTENGLLVALSEPLNLVNIDDLGYASNCRIIPAVSSPGKILAAVDALYRSVDPIAELIKGIGVEHVEVLNRGGEDGAEIIEAGGKADIAPPIIRFVNWIILEAARQKASDIHLDPTQTLTRIRFRVDGMLRDIMSSPKGMHAAVCTRVKVMGGLNIAEHRIPQDGRALVRTCLAEDVDVRINVVPTIYGEKINMRLLEQNRERLAPDRLGMDPETMKGFLELIRQPSAMTLVVGPTGSGKTTTLYSALTTLNTPATHIITVEDPVEYRMENINQIQVNPKTGLTFSQGLRAVLRQDPNVILIGEIRDRETAEIAFEAATTGHLVLSTVHSSDAAHAVARLATLGLNPFIVSSGLAGIISQRLVRKLCPHCKAPYTPPSAVLRQLEPENPAVLYKAAGCDKCRQTGYTSRVGIYEVVVLDAGMRDIIQSETSVSRLQYAFAKMHIRSLWAGGIQKVLEGTTTLEEVLRVTQNYMLTA
ncbi:MAG: Flp pilus assembly complex ATPase component TadA [Elusimicrobia bacterium]|nr:Flp pilus assembly complex ATPase component TadA [Elusimicrobiota bacterium]